MRESKRKRKKKIFLSLIPLVFLAAILFYLYSIISIDYSGECSKLERNIDRILFDLKIPDVNIISWRIEKKAYFRKWVEINKKIKLAKNKKQKLLSRLKDLKNFSFVFSPDKKKILIKKSNLIFAKILLIPEVLKPRLAIVIDDCGSSKKQVARLIELGLPLTFSILPYHRYTTFLAKTQARSGFDTLLHQPMEPQKSDNYALGKGALLVKMDKKQIKKIILENLEQTPFVKGVNNHMGSLFTENAGCMKVVLETLKKKNLFFLDSATSRNSICLKEADKIGIPCLRNNLFIDNTDKVEEIKKQILKAINIAKRRGVAIAIGHSTRKKTAIALRELKEKILSEVELVKLSELIKRY
jgi:polysaccharide deacetylase 2 family uncharacterized protein YibQ